MFSYELFFRLNWFRPNPIDYFNKTPFNRAYVVITIAFFWTKFLWPAKCFVHVRLALNRVRMEVSSPPPLLPQMRFYHLQRSFKMDPTLHTIPTETVATCSHCGLELSKSFATKAKSFSFCGRERNRQTNRPHVWNISKRKRNSVLVAAILSNAAFSCPTCLPFCLKMTPLMLRKVTCLPSTHVTIVSPSGSMTKRNAILGWPYCKNCTWTASNRHFYHIKNVLMVSLRLINWLICWFVFKWWFQKQLVSTCLIFLLILALIDLVTLFNTTFARLQLYSLSNVVCGAE